MQVSNAGNAGRETVSYNISGYPRRGFTIRLKKLKPEAPDFVGPQNFGSKGNFQHFC